MFFENISRTKMVFIRFCLLASCAISAIPIPHTYTHHHVLFPLYNIMPFGMPLYSNRSWLASVICNKTIVIVTHLLEIIISVRIKSTCRFVEWTRDKRQETSHPNRIYSNIVVRVYKIYKSQRHVVHVIE